MANWARAGLGPLSAQHLLFRHFLRRSCFGSACDFASAAGTSSSRSADGAFCERSRYAGSDRTRTDAEESRSWCSLKGKESSFCSHAALAQEHWTMKEPPSDIPYSVLGLNHVAIAVPDLEAASGMYRTTFGASVSEPKPQPEHGVTVVFVKVPGLTIELLHPLGDASPIAKFLQKNARGGVHHICLTVDNIHRAADHLKGADITLLGDGKPKIGAHGDPVVFINPKDTNGVLLELEEASGHLHDSHHERF